MPRLPSNYLSHVYIGEVKWDNAGNNNMWQWHTCTCLGHLGRDDRDRIISICCCATQGDQGKYSSDSRMTFVWLSRVAVADSFANNLRQCKQFISKLDLFTVRVIKILEKNSPNYWTSKQILKCQNTHTKLLWSLKITSKNHVFQATYFSANVKNAQV